MSKAENIQRWLDALALNPPQIQGYLHTTEGYCCLGVAYESLHGPNHWWLEQGTNQYRGVINGENWSTHLHGETAMAFNLHHTLPSGQGLQDFLSQYNDAGYSFDFIRKLIMTYVPTTDENKP